MTLTEIMRRFAKGSSKRAKALFEAFAKTEGDDTPPLMPARIDFSSTDSADRRRVIEVWTKKSQMLMHIADKMSGKLYSGIFSEQVQKNIEKYNRCRADKELPQLLTQMEIVDTWHEKWLSPDGMVLLERSHLPGKNPPILLQAYPMIDGESRSPVEDLLDQQKYVNRLVMLVDDVLTSTAKGVVLFPADQIPEGLTWQEVKRIWASPSGILPFKRTSKTIMPQQINPGTSFPGAVDMLQTQLSLFDDIAGIASGNSTHNTATGADMLRQQRENVMVSMLDLLIGFRSLTLRRDALIQTLSS